MSCLRPCDIFMGDRKQLSPKDFPGWLCHENTRDETPRRLMRNHKLLCNRCFRIITEDIVVICDHGDGFKHPMPECMLCRVRFVRGMAEGDPDPLDVQERDHV